MECSIDQAVKVVKSGVPLRVLVSTREHSYADSRKCLRLGEFGVVKLEPLNEIRQLDMIKRRMACPAKMDTFMQQLAKTKRRNPELSTSPFLLSLMIEVFRKHDAIPTHRVELYEKQIQGIVERSIHSRVGESEIKELLIVATEFLETLAFVCQMQREERDFKLATCMTNMQNLWMHDIALLAQIRKLLFGGAVVGLLSKVGSDEYRFSHLTLQEFLAARCAVRLYGHKAKKLVQSLMPLHSLLRMEVLQFTACMLKDNFTQFCKKVLRLDKEAGANCELVRAFLKERGTSTESAEVEEILRNRLLEIRGANNLIAGLCHPSSKLRDLLLSEMRQFKMPADGMIAILQRTAEDVTCLWHTRRAAILSIAQVAQMDHSSQGRAGALTWMLKMFAEKPDVLKDIHFALIKGLGTLLQGAEQKEKQVQDCIVLSQGDEDVLLQTLEHAV